MRVLHAYAWNGEWGGIETFLLTLARYKSASPELDSEFALIPARTDIELPERLRRLETKVYTHYGVQRCKLSAVLRARRWLTELLSAGNYRLVVCHSTRAQALFAPLVRLQGLPLIFWVHGAILDRLNFNWLVVRWIRRWYPDLLICNSEFCAREMAPLIYPNSGRVEVVHYSVAPPNASACVSERASMRAQLQTAQDACVIIHASRMVPWKGLITEIEALGRLAVMPGWVFWIAGGPQNYPEKIYHERLIRAANELGIASRVKFLGQCADVRRLLAAADVFVQANSSPEPFGIALVEALYAGLPVVTSAFGGAAEIVEQTCGILVPPGDISSISTALRALIEDPERRHRLAANAPARAAQLCDPEQQMRRIEVLLRSVLRQTPT